MTYLYGGPRHDCVRPFPFTVELGSVWVCDECGRRWQRDGDPAWSGTGWYDWDRPGRSDPSPFPKVRLRRLHFTAVR